MRKVLHDLARVFLVEFIILLVLAGLAMLGYLYRKPLLTTYHRHGQRLALTATRHSITPESRRRHSERFRRHMKALIRLGYLEERRFQQKFLTYRSPQHQAMIEEFRRIYPDSCYDIGWGKMLIITDRPERMPTWESLIRKYDVPLTDSNQPSDSRDPP
jgi:hypothetical protein